MRCAHNISASVSLPLSGDLHRARWFVGFCCGPLHWLHGPCMRCKGSFDNTSFPWLVLFLEVRPQESVSRRVMFLSFHIGFSLVSVAVVWAVLEMISGLDPSSATIELRYLKLDTVSNLCSLTLIFLLMPLMLLVISLVFSALISIL